MKDLNSYLEKARNLSEFQKIIIIVVAVILVGSVLMIFWINSTKNRIKVIGGSIRDLNDSFASFGNVSPTDQEIIK